MAQFNQVNPLQLDRWIKAVGQGDTHALEQLYYATSTAVYAYALTILKNSFDAEDVLQECYVSIQRSAGQYRSLSKPMPWILSITRNLCWRHLRQQRHYAGSEQAEYLGRTYLDPDEKLMLHGCMEQLTEEERQIVIFHAVAGFTHAETGKYMKLKTGTVMSKYHRAVQKLKQYYREEGNK